MAQAGDTLSIRGPGSQMEKERLVFRQTAAETDGALLEIDAHYAPGGQYPPDHFHPHQDEHFEVLSGEIYLRLAGEERAYRAGETFEVPRDTVHSMRGGDDEPTSVRWQTRPALTTERFYETLFKLIAAGRTDERGIPHQPYLGEMLRDFAEVFVLAWAPIPQR